MSVTAAKRDLPKNALRCLPLMIAAQRGYEIIINESFSITWNGGESMMKQSSNGTIPQFQVNVNALG